MLTTPSFPRPLVVTLLVVVLAGWALGGLRPEQLRCEYLDDPIAIDTPHPRLSWAFASGGRAERQTAYQVVVGSTPRDLGRGAKVLWDSGKVLSAEQNQIEYAGRPLAANEECWWRVRVWDGEGRPGAWSETARWRMGLLRPEDWQARWVGAPAEDSAPVWERLAWVWYPDDDPRRAAPVGARFFRQRLALPSGGRLRAATLLIAVDNTHRVFVNGVEVAQGGGWNVLQAVDLRSHLQPGANVLAVEAMNGATGPNPAGLLGCVRLEPETGPETVVPIDASWKCAREAAEGWTKLDFDDSGWVAPKVLGAYGIEPWGRPSAGMAPLPWFRREFAVEKPVRRAVVHVTGLGHYDLFLDGRRVGERVLDPAWSAYDKTVYYATFDLTRGLSPGRHAFGIMLGKGFYNTRGDRRVHGVAADRPLRFILQAHLTHSDGSESVLVSDESWRTAPGPITHSAILGGEDYDARRWVEGWNRPGFDDRGWRPAQAMDGGPATLRATFAPPLTWHDVWSPVLIDEPAPGVFVYDFGQNASAVPRLKVRGRAGQTVRLTPAEQRHGMHPRRNDGRGAVNPAGVGSPNYFEYTLRGGPTEQWTPQFSYSGFQYLQVEGAVPAGRPNPGGRPVVESLESVHVRSHAAPRGQFACSEPLFERIDRLVDWAVRANLSHVLTDCPHREKLGWLEVAYLMGPSIAGRYDVARFYGKVARDCAEAQRPDGLVPTVAPAYPAFSGGFAYTPEWGAAAVVVPWLVHTWTGDRRVLAENIAAMKGFVDYMEKTATDLVPVPGLGDWYDYGHGKPVGASQFTPVELSAMATFQRCARIAADASGVLGQTADQQRYADLAARVTRAFNARWFDGVAEYRNAGSPQCANSMALVLGLAPADRTEAVLARVVEDIRQRGNQQTAGDIGHWYLLQALGRHGRHDVIHDLTLRTNLGSYGFIVNNGWTSMPEAWDADTGASMNHCMLGHIQEWFLGDVAGIRPDETAPGFARVVIAPQPVGALTWAKGEYRSVRGRIATAWRREGGRFTLAVTVPGNVVATVRLPAAVGQPIREGGRPGVAGRGWRLVDHEAGVATLEVGSGRYEFASALPGAGRERE